MQDLLWWRRRFRLRSWILSRHLRERLPASKSATPMIAKFVSMAMLLLLPALTEAQPVARCSRPLSEAQLTELQKGSVPAPVIGQNVAKCGIAFEPTGEVIGRLRSAGMPQTVLDAVRVAIGPAERARQAEQASWQSIKDSRDPGLFEQFLREYPASQYAGAVREKLAALKPAAPPPPPAAIAPGAKKVNPKDGLTYVWIPPGTFRMGCSPGDNECFDNEKPAHQVTITKGFWLGETPVTQQAWQRVTGQNPSNFKGPSLPIETVNWDEAKAYCVAIGGRLPTEAEWEYAARAGSTGARYGNLDEIAWYSGNSGSQTHEVRRKSPNAFGLFDMLGNVWQWTAGWYGDYQPGAHSDPPGAASGQYRALRGGSWYNDSRLARVSYRGRYAPGDRLNVIGLRCVGE
jgi:formylglycine-generating enzyme required for sulfatase activity